MELLHSDSHARLAAQPTDRPAAPGLEAQRERAGARPGMLILNADDWGRDRETTDKTLTCLRRGALSSVSAMVFMDDSGRAAALARDQGVDAGLHINLTSSFTARSAPIRLAEQHGRVARYLLSSRLAQAIFHPGLANAFEYVVSSQVEQFVRLYGTTPLRVDGHHHMHLSANVIGQKLLPAGTIARRNFSFGAGEKSWINRQYRARQDRRLARRHRLTDYFFSLPPLERDRLGSIFVLARNSVVEVETHPVVPDEYQFLVSGKIFDWAGGIPVASAYQLPPARAAV
jgi:hypothetical protein